MWKQSKEIKAQVTNFQGTVLNHECIFPVWLRSHTTSLTSHQVCVALHSPKEQRGTLLSSSRMSLVHVKIWVEGLAADPALCRGCSCLTTACPWHLGDGHRHPNLNFSTTNPLLVSQQPFFLAASLSTHQTLFSYWSRGSLQRGERLKINKRRPVPLKEFSFIGSSPLPPFQWSICKYANECKLRHHF